jgi:two-component system phosphate regulon sensor histidine kinase PhoR
VKQPLILFNLILAYIFLQLAWWGYLIVEHSPEKIWMVVGEFSVFFILLNLGMRRLRRTIQEETNLNRQQKNFLLSVTHELKSPLASIKLYLQTLQKRDLDKEKQSTFIRNSLVDIERLDDLVGNMLLATKFENKTYSFPKEKINFTEIVQKNLENFQHLYQEKYEFAAHLEPGVEIFGDRLALSAAVNNLLENALKYSLKGSPISVVLERKEHHTYFQVADQGIGIEDSEKKKIFNKFYRASNEETRSTKGTGLGLFIVKQVLDNHKARIFVRNNQPQGSIFEVVF